MKKAIILGLGWFLLTTEGGLAGEHALSAPSGKFEITQTREDVLWVSRVVFRNSAPVTLEPRNISWPASYFISPNERWILRIQKTGSGDNAAFLYSVKDDRVVAVEPGINESAWDYFEKLHPKRTRLLYHTGVEFVGWKKDAVIISLHGSSTDSIPEHQVRNYKLRYDLKTHAISKE